MKNLSSILLVVFNALQFLSCKDESHLFTQVSASSSNITFKNIPEKHKAFSILYYLYYYNGGGVATGDINNDGLTDIYFTANNKAGNKLYLNKGNFSFEDITSKAGVAGTSDWCTGVTMADINNDGFLDIYVCAVRGEHGLKGRNELFINNGNATFTESAEKYGLALAAYSTQSVFFDYDHDGDLDCFLLNQSHHPNENIVDTIQRRKFDNASGDRLYRNDMNLTNTFTDVSAPAGIFQSSLGYGLGISVADMNNDGWDDIYIGNDFHENDYYYINNGDGTFKENGAEHFRHYSRFSMGNDIADYNNDGQPDVVTVDMLPPDERTLKTYGSDENYDIYQFKIKRNGYQDQVSRNCLQKNNGNGETFSDEALIAGVSATDWSWSPLFADFDNDGNKDLFISSGIVKRPVDLDYVRFVSELASKTNRNASDEFDDETIDKMPDGASHPYFFKGDGEMFFKDKSEEWGTEKMKGYFNGAAYADLDNDGDLDIVINCIDATATVLKNNSQKKNYISLSFSQDSLNRNAIGTKAYVFTNSKMQYQQLMLTHGFQSSGDTRLHFGLDSVNNIDSILIVWPNQQYQVIYNIKANQQLTQKKEAGAALFNYAQYFKPSPSLFQNITAQVNCNWQHRENNFIDFNVQYLIPHKQSTRGPKVAVADINGDGLDDFFACGARGQPGVLMMQQKNGTFTNTAKTLFEKYAECEDVDAVFFDANGDKNPDLLVISGGNEPQPTTPFLLTDRLFLNDGNGGLIEKENFLIQQFYTKSCVTVSDIDHDGDSDIFIGTLASTLANDYGKPMTSSLFLNDGKANFTLATFKTIQLSMVGMVTDAAFMDVNKDGWDDLVIAGEWMSLKVFINNQGVFTASDIKGSSGLWQCIQQADVNHDGFPDILAGNWGVNNKLQAGKTGPAKLYVKDFDNNGSLEQVMGYTINGEVFPFLAKDELERSLPVLKKHYLKYSEVAGKTVPYIFFDLFKDYEELTAETLATTCYLNDGKGNFTETKLPANLQLAPVFSFAPIPAPSENSYIAAGNFYGVIPYEGRYDAQQPSLFSFTNNTPVYNDLLPGISGEIRDMKWINYGNEKLLIIARNNEPLLFYQLNKKS